MVYFKYKGGEVLSDKRSIGVFDSGLGGLTVLKELRRIMPNENYVYFGDTGRVPYGSRSDETILKYAAQDEAFLLSHDVKIIIAACGTVSSLSLDKESRLPTPFFEMVTPAARAASRVTKNGKIGVIGTPATIKSAAHRRELLKINGHFEISAEACPLFVPMVESGWYGADDEVVKGVVKRYIKPIKDSGCDTLIMGCTHYPVLRYAIDDYLGGEVALINPGEELAREVYTYLNAKCMLNDKSVIMSTLKSASNGENKTVNTDTSTISINNNGRNSGEGRQSGKCCGVTEYFVSDRPDSFMQQALILLGEQARGSITQIDIEKQGVPI